MISRFLDGRLPGSNERRLAMITGARQTGKTTLAQARYPELNYISLDEIEERFRLRDLPTRSWAGTVGPAVLDEAQKEPAIFEKIKFAFDRGDIDFSLILGSSQILMLKRVRESLAGRVYVYELWPLMLAELLAGEARPNPPLFDKLLSAEGTADHLLTDEPTSLIADRAHALSGRLEYAAMWGGMPALLDLPAEERREWLRSYTNTYLERDLSDLARLDDLAPFRRFLRLAAIRSGQLVSYADIARDAAISPKTARNYLGYLQLSYQAFLLQPYFENPSKRLVKSPKVYWTDIGLMRQLAGFWGQQNGQLLETFVVGECFKWIKTMRPESELFFYRTHGGLEVDLIATTESGIWGLEIKSSRQVSRSLSSSVRRLAAELSDRWRGGLVVYQGDQLIRIEDNLWAIPVGRLLS